MKAALLTFGLLFSFGLSAQADTICKDLQKIEANLTAKLAEINEEINRAETSNQADAHINRYEKVYRQYQDVKAEYLDLCVN